ncbi:ankyrin repeat-containing domain protein [Xylariales sp. PMI_506]|nr:ankyrin repeat-containing domain protein [Xylariales sp. PMI_506]
MSPLKFSFRRHAGKKATGSQARQPVSTEASAGEQSTSITSSVPATTAADPVTQERHEEQICNEPEPPKSDARRFDLWKKALDHLKNSEGHKDVPFLTESFLTQSSDGSASGNNLGIEDIHDRIKEALGSPQHDNTTRSMVEKALEIIQKFTSVADIAVSFDPLHAALPWTAVRSVIVLLVADVELKAQLLAGIAKVTSLLVQCDTYQQLYMEPDPALRPPEAIIKNLKESIFQAYFKSQLFLAFAWKRKQSKIRALEAAFKLEDLRKYIDDLSICEGRLVDSADDCEKHCHLSVRRNIKELLQLAKDYYLLGDRIKELHSALDRVDKHIQIELLEWISSIEYTDHQKEVANSRTADTCEWLIHDKRFCRWWASTKPSEVLWLKGSAGTGKTFLTSKVIDYIQNSYKSSTGHEGFAFFYCNRTDIQRGEHMHILRSCVRQLSSTTNDPDGIRKSLLKVSLDLRQKGSKLDLGSCRDQLLESIELYDNTIIVLDALDECKPESSEQLVESLSFLLSKAKKPLKIFISSRPDYDVQRLLRSWPSVEIEATNNQADIEKFVVATIARHNRWNQMSKSLKVKIIQTLQDGSQGMYEYQYRMNLKAPLIKSRFQWANLQIQQLLQLRVEGSIRERLGKLPIGLKQAYDDIYARFAGSLHEKSIVERACMWVMCASRPLTTMELVGAVNLDLDAKEHDDIRLSHEIDEDLLLDLCNNLLILDHQLNVWRFCHLSVAEYFEKNHWSIRDAHCYAAKVCLKLLIETYKSSFNQSETASSDIEPQYQASSSSNDANDMKPPGLTDPNHPFHVYLQLHWYTHVQEYERRTEKEKPDIDSTLKFLLKVFFGAPEIGSNQYHTWFRHVSSGFGLDERPDIYNFIRKDLNPNDPPIFTISRLSLYIVLQDWWDNEGIPISQDSQRGDSLLIHAALGGSQPICELLIKRGSPVNRVLSTGEYGSALAAAVCDGEFESVKYLVENGADINLLLPTGYYGSALAAAAASYTGYESVKYLIENGADINLLLPTGDYGSALAAAAGDGEFECVKYLVENGADINLLLPTGRYGSALAAAAAANYRGFESVKYLVENGADINLLLPTGRYGSALAAAAAAASYTGFESVKYLVENGADINLLLPTGDYGSALAAAAAAASYRGFESVKYLVENGADINLLLPTGDYGSALATAAAASDGEFESVKYLVENGADINLLLPTGYYGSALAAAAANYTGFESVKYLIENGADINLLLPTGDYGSALAAAAGDGEFECVKYLVENGADINLLLPTGDYGSALAAAAAATNDGEFESVKYLVENGADINLLLPTGDYGSALAAAAFWGHIQRVQTLLELGAMTELRLQGPFPTALQAASTDIPSDVKHSWWDDRDQKEIQEDKCKVVRLLQLHSTK